MTKRLKLLRALFAATISAAFIFTIIRSIYHYNNITSALPWHFALVEALLIFTVPFVVEAVLYYKTKAKIKRYTDKANIRCADLI